MVDKELINLSMLGCMDDVPKGSKNIFLNILEMIHTVKNPKILEVGTYTGKTISKIADIFPNAECFAIDNWKLDETEFEVCRNFAGVFFTIEDVRNTFFENTKGKNITLIEGDSTIILRNLVEKQYKFNFIYIDGSHTSLDTIIDLVLSWMLLEKEGILAIDDYLYTPPGHSEDTPRIAVDYFMSKFSEEYIIINSGYRMFLQKK